jgi:hypothetical protein
MFPPPGDGVMQAPSHDSASARFPIKLDDAYPCRGHRPDGREVHFDDLLDIGDRVGDPVPGDPLNAFPPFGVVVRRSDGLWVEAE